MKSQKFITFAILGISTGIVVFNSLIDLSTRLFSPKLNLTLFFAFGMAISGSYWYLGYNWRK